MTIIEPFNYHCFTSFLVLKVFQKSEALPFLSQSPYRVGSGR